MTLTCAEMKRTEERAFAAGHSAEGLMDDAGEQIAQFVQGWFSPPGIAGDALVFYGKGHNGGDALVAARHLFAAGWRVELQAVFPEESLAPLTRKRLAEFEEVRGKRLGEIEEDKGARVPWAPKVILDGILGIGAHGALREPIRSAAAALNQLRLDTSATVFALDLPTGFDADSGDSDGDAVTADVTLCIGFIKRGMLADAAINTVGRLALLPLPELEAFLPKAGGVFSLESPSEWEPNEKGAGHIGEESVEEGADNSNAEEAATAVRGELVSVATPQTLVAVRRRRAFDTHKGACGRVGIVAGSKGFTGAAVMAADAAVRAGAGLVSLYVTADVYPIIAAKALPEVMVTPVECYLDVLDRNLDVLAIGPGLGDRDAGDVLALIDQFPRPMVVDADALNILARTGDLAPLRRARAPRLLTPHPGEMARLFPASATLERKATVEQFLAQLAGNRELELTLLLKGARTVVGQRVAPLEGTSKSGEVTRLSYNTTGNPGMASGGMGDILTGTCAALAGQGMPLFDAARLGAWLCGRAAEMAISHGGQSPESLIATDLLEQFGRAFGEI
jgi:hydroxyethylthiazole kinase-like uncharacterized protein yjeF